MPSRLNNLPSFTQNLRPREKKMTMAEAVVILADFFVNCAEKKRKDRTNSEYILNISTCYLKSTLEKGKGTKKGTWTNIVQNAREIANSIFFYLDEREKIELEEIFSHIFELNGTKGISGFEKNDRYGQCKYCWRYVSIVGKSKWAVCHEHSGGSRDPVIRKIWRLESAINTIRAKVHNYIYVNADTLGADMVDVAVDKDACPCLSKLMDYKACSPQEVYALLDFDVSIKRIETYELVWAMASYEAWYQAHDGTDVDLLPETNQDAVVEITDEMWERVNATVEPAPSAPNLLHAI